MSKETELRPRNGWAILPVLFGVIIAAVLVVIWCGKRLDGGRGGPAEIAMLVGAILVAVITGVCLRGLFALAPNEAVAALLFGAYKGTLRRPGFWWANPLYTRKRISLRVRNMTTDTLKVNDIRGNPIEIAAVVVWRVEDTYAALFEVDNYETFLTIQSESALRHLASSYPYDASADHEMSLRGSIDEVSKTLLAELQIRLAKAGVVVDETRLSHLAYAPEIAGAMLRRQQAEAVVAARQRIVEGAVGMVEIALEHLARNKAIVLDDERKAAMVTNLMVVLCGDHGAQPVVNAGSLYT